MRAVGELWLSAGQHQFKLGSIGHLQGIANHCNHLRSHPPIRMSALERLNGGLI